MIALVDELYPTFRWYLFDAAKRYAAPVTVFGSQRAALYLGELYLVLTSLEHVRTLSRHFDRLIRDAERPTDVDDHPPHPTPPPDRPLIRSSTSCRAGPHHVLGRQHVLDRVRCRSSPR